MASKSNALFHFTSSEDTIIKILDNGFLPMYCKEEIDDLFGDEIELFNSEKAIDIGLNTFPLVSFCDIPLTRVDEHVKEYGDYAIGMSQNWGLKNGLTPLMYYHSDMPLFKNIKELYDNNRSIKKREFENSIVNSSTIMASRNSIEFLKYQKCFFKPMYIKREKYQKNEKKNDLVYKYFHLENEWRYVPNIEEFENRSYSNGSEMNFFIWSDDIIKYNTYMIKNIDKFKTLKIDVHDIEYIIVKNKQDIEPFLERLKDWGKNNKKYKEKTIDLLMTKIISLYNIKTDF